MAKKSTITSYLRITFISIGAVVAFSLLFVFLLNPYSIESPHAKKPVVMLGNYLSDLVLRLHVDKSPEWMRKRLQNRDYIRFASSFYTLEMAEEAIQAVLDEHNARIEAWVRDPTVTKNMLKSFRMHFKSPVGYGLKEGDNQTLEELYDVKVLIRKINNYSYKVITAYPIPRKR